MKFEAFEPKKFKNIQEMPTGLQKNFVETSDKANFVRNEAIDADKMAAQKAERRGNLSEKLFGEEGKVHPMSISHEEALRENKEIERKYQSKIAEIESVLGPVLSDEVKQKIYQEALWSHREENETSQEKETFSEEESVYKNEQVLKKAQEIAAMSKEQLLALSEEDRRQIVVDMRWNRYAERGNTLQAPDEIMDAESKIYSTYEPSGELQRIHSENNSNALKSIEDNLWSLSKEWNRSDQSRKMEICQHWIDQLTDGYNIPRAGIFLSENDGSETAAACFKGLKADSVGISEKTLRNNTLENILPVITHEVAHLFQNAAMKEAASSESVGKIKNDIEWFKLQEAQSRYREDNNFKSSHKRYLGLPVEKDAYEAQGHFAKKLGDSFSRIRNKILENSGMADYETIDRQGKLARWAEKFLNANEEFDGDKLDEIAQKELRNEGPSLVKRWFGGKTREESRKIIGEFLANEEKANRLLNDESKDADR